MIRVHKLMRNSAAVLPTEWEFFGVRLMALYAMADAVRGMDLCFDATDGACRAVWGVVPITIRLAAWCFRDTVLLVAVALYLDYSLGWAIVATGGKVHWIVKLLLRGVVGFVLAGLSIGFYALAMTNLLDWQVAIVLLVVTLNMIWAPTSWKLLHDIFPRVTQHFAREGRQFPKWAEAALVEARLGSRLVLAANCGILLVFPCLIYARFVTGGLRGRPLIPAVPIGEWVGWNTLSPLLSDLPADVILNPALEVVELGIGWAQLAYCIRLVMKPAADYVPWGPSGMPPPSCGFVDRDTVGKAMREATVGVRKND